jgi:hypothetical protein
MESREIGAWASVSLNQPSRNCTRSSKRPYRSKGIARETAEYRAPRHLVVHQVGRLEPIFLANLLESSPGKSDGPDYSGAPLGPYFLDFDDVCRPGGSPLLEVPVTIMRLWPRADRLRAKLAARSVVRAALNRLMPPLSWLRPNGRNTRAMLRLLGRAIAEQSSALLLSCKNGGCMRESSRCSLRFK